MTVNNQPDPQEKPYDPPIAVPGEAPSPSQPAEVKDKKRFLDGSWIWGILLIVLGGLFLLQNLTPFRIANWWAIFLLIPAAGSFADAWIKYRQAGSLVKSVRGSLLGGFIFLGVAGIFLLNLNISLLWPLIIIAAGLALMANSFFPD